MSYGVLVIVVVFVRFVWVVGRFSATTAGAYTWTEADNHIDPTCLSSDLRIFGFSRWPSARCGGRVSAAEFTQ